MAVYDLEEQEQLDALKAWWRQNAKRVLIGVVTIALAVGGYKAWLAYQHDQSQRAAEIYATLQQAAAEQNLTKIGDASKNLMDNYSGTGYAGMAAMLSARAYFAAGDNQHAQLDLQWAIDHARDDGLRDAARLHLAAVMLDEKKFDEVLRQLEQKHDEAFDARYIDLKGDVLAAQGKTAEARAAYQQALEKSDARSPYRGVIQMKLDALGGAQ
ncbi:MAG: tetratricopeptide repeat protein [Pseudomonadota bacterium]